MQGFTGRSQTFNNAPLVPQGRFNIIDVEAWTLETRVPRAAAAPAARLR